jgi:hypothetical protein
MFYLLFLSDSFRHPAEFPAGAFNAALRLSLLCAVHLRQGFGKPSARAAQNGKRHLQIAFHLCDCRGLRADCLSLRFQKQFRVGENALASGTRAFAPCGVQLRSLSGIASVLYECGSHAFTVVRAHACHWHQILHRALLH